VGSGAFAETAASTATAGSTSAPEAAAGELTGRSAMLGAFEIIQVVGKGQHDVLL
jgi:hypothetical protein